MGAKELWYFFTDSVRNATKEYMEQKVNNLEVICYATKTNPFGQRVRSVLEVKGINYKFIELVRSYNDSTEKIVVKEEQFKDSYANAISKNEIKFSSVIEIKAGKWTGKIYMDTQGGLACCRALEAIFKEKNPSVIASDNFDVMLKNEIFLEFINGMYATDARFAHENELKVFLKVLNGKMCEYGDEHGKKYIF